MPDNPDVLDNPNKLESDKPEPDNPKRYRTVLPDKLDLINISQNSRVLP